MERIFLDTYITRKTDKGLPRYQDAVESDVFILSGAEDLAPVLQPDGSRFEDKTSAPGYTIHRYRPRIEGLFARIERWTDRATGDAHWRSITRYAYHHGYFNGVEREFRGFGMVEQWDTESFAALSASDNFPTGGNVDAASHVPPVYTKTWFHTGVFLDREHISDFFAGLIDGNDQGEYYREPGLNDAQAGALLLADTLKPVTFHTIFAIPQKSLLSSIVRQLANSELNHITTRYRLNDLHTFLWVRCSQRLNHLPKSQK